MVSSGNAQRSEYRLDSAGNRSLFLNSSTILVLHGGDTTYSPNGRFFLAMQTEGNLVLYTSAGTALWSTPTVGSGAYVAILQTDGNLVLYSPSAAVWNSETYGNDCAQIQLQNDGNLVIYGLDGVARWSSATGGH